MLDLVIWTARKFPQREIRIREHPGEALLEADVGRLKETPNIRLMSPDKFSLKDVFSGCRVAVAINSTTILEAVASGVVPLILDVGGFGPYHPNLAEEGAAIEVRDFADARIQLERIVEDDRFCASFSRHLDRAREHLFARNSEQALQAIVAEIPGIGR
jgi:glycosyltransferase involved in cell wall biosynthesis